MDTIVIDGPSAEAISPEGLRASMPVPELLERIVPEELKVVLPDGIKTTRSCGKFIIWVHETAPAIYTFKWIAPNSPARFGRGTKYRMVRISLPYLITFCVFSIDGQRNPTITPHNECFFRNAPLERLDDGELCYPALLNCSKHPSEEGHPLAWICTQHLDAKPLLAITDPNLRMRRSFRALMETLLGSGFNFSSEDHEGQSWFTETVKRKVDERVSTIERWQEETAKDPMFVLQVPWISTGRTLEQMIERIFDLCHASKASVSCSDDIARIIFNNKREVPS